MKIIGETSRLYLREFLQEDGIHLYEMNTDPEVIKYTGDAPFASREAAVDFLGNYREYQLNGVGRWAVIRKQDNAFLGWCGLKFHPDKGITELGYRLYREVWNKGYATEASEAALEYGFNVKKLMVVQAHVHPDNTASQRVLEKLGMVYEKDSDYVGMPVKIYKLENPDYRIAEISAAEVLEVRHPVLRPGRPREDAIFEGDTDAGTFHLGVYYGELLTGVVTLMKRPDANGDAKGTYQLRGMGVLEEFRKQGVGMALVTAAEKRVKTDGGVRIWMNAREKAVSFYSRMGYVIKGNRFDIPGVGPHFYMDKTL